MNPDRNGDGVTVIRHSMVSHALGVLRACDTSAVEFRGAVRGIARALAHEATRNLPLEDVKIETPLEITDGARMTARVIAAPILRAGLGMLDGFLDIVPAAATGFIGLKRNEETLEPYEYYRNLPNLFRALTSSSSIRCSPPEGASSPRSGRCRWSRPRRYRCSASSPPPKG